MATHDKTQPPDKAQARDLSEQAVALAEQLGRIAGSIEGTAETWLPRQTLTEQLTRVRDGAAQMLRQLSEGVQRGRASVRGINEKKGKTGSAGARAADPSRAPGKRHRKPAPSPRGVKVKKSNEAIPKMRTAAAARQRRKSYA